MLSADAMISQTEMKTLGETLKLRRKEMNISLKEAENATSIRSSYLHSLEEGDVAKLISPVYAQGFLRQYAAFLGIDGDKIAKEYPHFFNRPEAQEFAYGIGTLEVRGNPGAGVKWFPNAVWVIISVVLLVAAWYFARYFELI
jgi:cytoskeletal protein RodZ